MIKVDGLNCWSPLHPLEYTLSINGGPAGIAAVPADFACGGAWCKSLGLALPWPQREHMAAWNLQWLVSPIFDTLPAICKAGDLAVINKMPKPTSEFREEVLETSQRWLSDLLADPVVFVNKVGATRSKLPGDLSQDELMARALVARGDSIVAPYLKATNVIQGTFRKVS